MIHRRFVLVGICLVFLSAVPGGSEGASVGTTGASFLKLNVGARAEALGEGGVVGLEGVESLYWNPAGLVTAQGPTQLMVSHQQLWQDVNATAFALAFHGGRLGTVALGVEQLGVGSWNNLAGEPAVDAGDLAVLVGLGRSLSDRISVGVAARTMRSTIGDQSAGGFSVDCGFRYRVSDGIALAGAVRNLGSGLSYEDGDADPLPAIGSLGGVLRWDRLALLGEARTERGIGAYGALGTELRLHPALALRAGSRLGSPAERASSDVTWGAGIGLANGLSIDYCFHDSELGGSHQFSGTYRFGGLSEVGGEPQGGAGGVSGRTVPSNFVVVKDLVAASVDSLLRLMPRPKGNRIVLRKAAAAPAPAAPAAPATKAEGGRSGDEVLENVLTERLTGLGFSVRLAAGAANADSASAVQGSDPVLEYRVLELKVSYPSGGRHYYIGRKELQRMVWVNLHLRLVNGTGDTVQWAGTAERGYRDIVPFSLVNSLKSEGFGFTDVQSEDQKWDRVLEPLIATAIVGGLIYLFYSNKGSE